jgi:hypothetical protein
MGKLIAQLADVLEGIADQVRHTSRFVPVAEARKDVISVVAERHQVHPNTVADGFIRRLRPEINSTPEFDVAVGEWLNGKPQKLRSALLRHIGDGLDARRVFDVIDEVPEKRNATGGPRPVQPR